MSVARDITRPHIWRKGGGWNFVHAKVTNERRQRPVTHNDVEYRNYWANQYIDRMNQQGR